ncbi:CAP domain-containing protein [Roseibium aestuarii]|uniref:CAP domain-containing protein n=1 Tax=Roseibium aestuarii TaxID=2600299 RepID=A0ABW4JR77_9HYPH|nr:CAP domain-containing protein [Roseibium aestuarii]
MADDHRTLLARSHPADDLIPGLPWRKATNLSGAGHPGARTGQSLAACVSRRGLIAAGASLLLASCAGLPFGDMAEDGPSFTVIPVDQSQVLALINAYRAGHGRAPLRASQALVSVSADMARRIAEQDSMDTWAHSRFGLGQRLADARYDNYAAAENLGAGYANLPAAFDGWKGSPGHNKNLLNPYVTEVGVASIDRSNGKWRHFWVMTLGRPRLDGRPELVPGYS